MSTQISISPVIKLEVNTTPITGGSAGQILFQTTSNTVGESANLSWNNTNLIFTLGSTATRIFNFRPEDTTGTYGNSCSIRGGNGNGRLDFYSASNITEVRDNIILLTSATGPSVQVGTGSINLNVASSTRLQVAPTTGNVLIGTTTDAGFKLDVNGTARVQGNATIGSTSIGQTQLNIFSSSRADLRLKSSGSSDNSFSLYTLGGSFGSCYAQFGTNDGENAANQGGAIYTDSRTGIAPPIRLLVKATGTLAMTNAVSVFNTANVGINTTTDAGFRLDVNGTARIGTTDGIKFLPGNNSSIVFSQGVDRISLTRLNSDKLQISAAGTNTYIGNGISTNAGAHTWLLEGENIAVVTFDTTKYVKVFINGTIYKLAVCV